MKIQIYDIENIPFGTQITIKTLDNNIKKPVVIVNAIAFSDGTILPFENISHMHVYLG